MTPIGILFIETDFEKKVINSSAPVTNTIPIKIVNIKLVMINVWVFIVNFPHELNLH